MMNTKNKRCKKNEIIYKFYEKSINNDNNQNKNNTNKNITLLVGYKNDKYG